MSTKCVCPGSYDPITMGHLDVVQRAATMFAEVVVAVVHNPAKAGLFDPTTRQELITESIRQHAPEVQDRVTVTIAEQALLVDFCRANNAHVIVKGVRGGPDFAYELPMALMNKHMSGVETVFLPGAPELNHVSSSLIKEIARGGADVSGMVPEPVRLALAAHFQ